MSISTTIETQAVSISGIGQQVVAQAKEFGSKVGNKLEYMVYEAGVTFPVKHPLLFAAGKYISLMAAANIAGHLPQIIHGAGDAINGISNAFTPEHLPHFQTQESPICTLPADGQVPVETTAYDALRDHGVEELALNEALTIVQAHNPGVDFNALQPGQVLNMPQSICDLNQSVIDKNLGTFNVTISEGGNLLQAIRSYLEGIGVPANQIEATTSQVVQNNGGMASLSNTVHADTFQINGGNIEFQDLSRLPAEVLTGSNSNPEVLATQPIVTGAEPSIQPTASLEEITKAMPEIQNATTTTPEQNSGNGGLIAIGGVTLAAGAIGAFLANRLGLIGKKKA